jgi:hypothetical protein
MVRFGCPPVGRALQFRQTRRSGVQRPKHNLSHIDFKGSGIVQKTRVSNRLSFARRPEMNGR